LFQWRQQKKDQLGDVSNMRNFLIKNFGIFNKIFLEKILNFF
jgi:hypothetical protein